MVRLFMTIMKPKMDVIYRLGSLEPQFLYGWLQILELPIVAEKEPHWQTEDRQVVKQAQKDKIKNPRFCHVERNFSAARCPALSLY